MAANATRLVRGIYGDDPHACEPRLFDIVQEVFIDRDGLIIGAVKGSTLKPYTQSDMEGVPLEDTLGRDLGAPHQYKLVFMNYEETGMAHGDYLMMLCEKHRATGSREVKRQATCAYGAIRRLADTIAETNPYGRGWWPKPYGGMNDLEEMFETSIDQTIKIVLALEQYDRQLATAAERRWIRMQSRAMADWWIEHHYTTRYFGNCCWWDRHQAPHSSSALLYLVRRAMAWTPGRKPRRLRDAWEHLLSHRQWVMIKCGGLNTHNLAIECLHQLDRLDPTHSRYWRRARNVLLDHTVSETDPHTGTNGVPGYGVYNAGLRTACSIAEAARWSGRCRHVEFARKLLRIYNCEAKFFHHDQSHKPREHNQVSWWFDALSGHHYVAWLLAYWRLRNLC